MEQIGLSCYYLKYSGEGYKYNKKVDDAVSTPTPTEFIVELKSCSRTRLLLGQRLWVRTRARMKSSVPLSSTNCWAVETGASLSLWGGEVRWSRMDRGSPLRSASLTLSGRTPLYIQSCRADKVEDHRGCRSRE
jgi:hypothetical protein